MKRRRSLLFMVMAFMLLFSMHVTAFAAESVKKVTVKFNVNEEGEEPEISVSGDSHSHITEILWYDSGEKEWYDHFSDDLKPDDTVKCAIKIEPDDGYVFNNLDRRNAWKFTGDKSRVTYRSSDYNASQAVVNLSYGPIGGKIELEDIYWDNTIAKWDGIDNAKSYTLLLYKGNNKKYTFENITNTSIDLSSYLTEKGTYYFKVKPIFEDNRIKGEYVESYNSLQVNTPYTGSSNYNDCSSYNYDYSLRNTWKLCPDSKWRYYDANGYSITLGWHKINHVYYYFANGYMKTGWIQDGTDWYFCDRSNGAMLTNQLIQDNGKIYYLCPDGRMVKGWATINAKWYYFNYPNGEMLANTYIKVDGKEYYLYPDGHMAQNEYIGSRYAGPDGSLK
ncbi:MAG: hypothetical protein Q4D02_00770 [Clostridia bacterium]|nr:hypothetical protein [Clostridia bacterium]